MEKAEHVHATVKTETFGWTKCVATRAAHCNGAAHGAVTHIETCLCGARRATETNGRHSEQGRWEDDYDLLQIEKLVLDGSVPLSEAGEPRHTTATILLPGVGGDRKPGDGLSYFDGVAMTDWTVRGAWVVRHRRGPDGQDWGNRWVGKREKK